MTTSLGTPILGGAYICRRRRRDVQGVWITRRRSMLQTCSFGVKGPTHAFASRLPLTSCSSSALLPSSLRALNERLTQRLRHFKISSGAGKLSSTCSCLWLRHRVSPRAVKPREGVLNPFAAAATLVQNCKACAWHHTDHWQPQLVHTARRLRMPYSNRYKPHQKFQLRCQARSLQNGRYLLVAINTRTARKACQRI